MDFFQRYKMGVEIVRTDRRRRRPVFLLHIASIFAAAAEKLKHVSMCCKNTGGPAGAQLLANWTGNKMGLYNLVMLLVLDPRQPAHRHIH